MAENTGPVGIADLGSEMVEAFCGGGRKWVFSGRNNNSAKWRCDINS